MKDTNHDWDVIVIGAGAAGLSSALMLGRARRRTLVIDAGSPRNRFATHMHGVLGNEGTPPAELLARGRAEAAAYGVRFTDGTVEKVEDTGAGLTVAVAGRPPRRTRALIVATGLTDELPAIPGLAERWGRSVLHCPYCHGWEVRDQRLGVLTTSPLGRHHAELLRQWSDQLVVFTAGLGDLDVATEQRLRARGIELISEAVTEIIGDVTPFTVRVEGGTEIVLDAIFTAATLRPHDDFLAPLGLARTDGPMGSFLSVDVAGRTSNDRIWAIGNVVNPGANVPMAIGSGAMTGGAVNAALVTEDFDAAIQPTDSWPAVAPAQFWEERYAGSDQVWSGRPNAVVVDLASQLTPGRSLDLGCGEGADVAFLAQQGWQATGIDISPTAIQRGSRAASHLGLAPHQATFAVSDLAGWQDAESYDLVTASYLHSPVALPRTEILRSAAGRVATGGHLLVLSHADFPPWVPPADRHEHHFLTAEQEIEELALDPDDWEVLVAESRPRTTLGPDGQPAKLDDTVVLLRRT